MKEEAEFARKRLNFPGGGNSLCQDKNNKDRNKPRAAAGRISEGGGERDEAWRNMPR